jgi:hypothetical protein
MKIREKLYVEFKYDFPLVLLNERETLKRETLFQVQ